MNKRQPVSAPKITALYERLSRDDDQRNESVSIANQKKMLEEYARKNGFGNVRHFVDDGITGTVFNRPGLNAMVEEVKAGNVATVIIKDQSRIGRDVLEVGLLKRTFEENGVRFIAAEDGLDTAKGFDIMSIIRDVLNEFYVADTSRKIKAVYKAKGEDGKHLISAALYGYVKDPDDKEKNQWLIDPEAASVVRRIFQMTIDGKGPYEIARILTDDKITRPSVHMATRDGGECKPELAAEPYVWNGGTVANMLDRLEYAGCTVNFRTYKDSYKDKRSKYRDKGEWLVFEDTQEAIIPREVWETAQKCRKVKRRRSDLGEANPFTGLTFCTDCGSRMYNHRSGDRSYDSYDSYSCCSYTRYPRRCTCHHIKTSTLRHLTLDAIREVSEYVREHEEDFIQYVREMHELQSAETAKAQQKQLEKCRKRHEELDRLMQRIYEDMVAGRITEKRFEVLSGGYENEQAELAATIDGLQNNLDAFNAGSVNVDSFIALVRRYADIPELTPSILNEYIEKIVVHEADRSSGRREQRVDIHFNFIGRVTVPGRPEPEPFDKVEHRRAQFRAYYYRHHEKVLARKAAYDARKRAEKAAQKEAESRTA